MNKSRITNLEKKMTEGTRKHREVKRVYEDNGVYTTKNGRSLTKDADGSFLFEDGTIHYDVNEPNPYNEIGLITINFISVKEEDTKDEVDGK